MFKYHPILRQALLKSKQIYIYIYPKRFKISHLSPSISFCWGETPILSPTFNPKTETTPPKKNTTNNPRVVATHRPTLRLSQQALGFKERNEAQIRVKFRLSEKAKALMRQPVGEPLVDGGVGWGMGWLVGKDGCVYNIWV